MKTRGRGLGAQPQASGASVWPQEEPKVPLEFEGTGAAAGLGGLPLRGEAAPLPRSRSRLLRPSLCLVVGGRMPAGGS